ncbi:MAG: tryptophan synthase subunit alpha [Gammaproteobacteria bacterium]|nr:tryptophan synthase subunit alpha [Gammaproteobacteria bacterium]
MSRIADCFARLGAAGRKALVPYLMAGDPSPGDTVPLMHALAAAGADIIELGVPFTDPMADGPVIQAAGERALAAGMNLTKVLGLMHEFRRDDARTPVVLMGYQNPIEAMGVERFTAAAAAAGVDGVLTVDLPPEEAGGLLGALGAPQSPAPIFLLSPTTTPERIRRIVSVARGFVYYVSLKGVTGSDRIDPADIAPKVAAIRQLTDLPVGVGFGIRDGDTAARIAQMADAVVVGSALVGVIAAAGDAPARLSAASQFVAGLRRAMDAAVRAPAAAGEVA